MSKSILIIDYETEFIDTLCALFMKEGYYVFRSDTGTSAFSLLQRHPDLIILNLEMPEAESLDILRSIKQDSETSAIPVIGLSTKDSETDEIISLEIGADDYITKPVQARKLLARIRVLLRQQRELQADHDVQILSFGELEIHVPNYTISFDNASLTVPRKEFDILVLLALHPGKVFTRNEIAQAVWGTSNHSVSRTIDVHIGRIRKRLNRFATSVETVPGVGYKFHYS